MLRLQAGFARRRRRRRRRGCWAGGRHRGAAPHADADADGPMEGGGRICAALPVLRCDHAAWRQVARSAERAAPPRCSARNAAALCVHRSPRAPAIETLTIRSTSQSPRLRPPTPLALSPLHDRVPVIFSNSTTIDSRCIMSPASRNMFMAAAAGVTPPSKLPGGPFGVGETSPGLCSLLPKRWGLELLLLCCCLLLLDCFYCPRSEMSILGSKY